MNKTQGYLEGMVALVLMAYGIGLMLGEVLREMIFGKSKSTGSTPGCSCC